MDPTLRPSSKDMKTTSSVLFLAEEMLDVTVGERG
jgi:hypothetical protein